MPRRRLHLFVLLLLIVAPVVAQADKTDDFVRGELKRQNIPGLSLAVVKDGKIIKADGYGVANIKLKTPATPETVYKICSVSKQFIATGIMLLVQQGRLSLDDPVSKYLEGTPATWQQYRFIIS
jgi:CubicO group peptidase (beta-lactamase class C family)